MKEIWLVSAEPLRYTRSGGQNILNAQLKVVAQVKNLGFEKRVGLRYRINQSLYYIDSIGQWSRQVNSDIDEFVILSRSDILPEALVTYALFYQVGENIYWDTNDGDWYAMQF